MKTWEMIKDLAENPKLRFKNDLGDVVIISDRTKRIVWELKDEEEEEDPFIIYSNEGKVDNLHIEWELIQEPVDFKTAANSGKRIKHERWGGYYFLHETLHILQNCDNALGLINGKWLIES